MKSFSKEERNKIDKELKHQLKLLKKNHRETYDSLFRDVNLTKL